MTEPPDRSRFAFGANWRNFLDRLTSERITEAERALFRQADVLFFDGTLFTDDEMIAAGLSEKTGTRMGHVPISAPGGSLAGLADLPCRRILLHINNTNPILLGDSAERRQVEAAGFEVAFDGMEVPL